MDRTPIQVVTRWLFETVGFGAAAIMGIALYYGWWKVAFFCQSVCILMVAIVYLTNQEQP